MVINENEFPSLVRQTSTTSAGMGNGHISRTPFNPNGNAGIIPPGTPTAAAITAGLANIPSSYGSKDASGSMAGLQGLQRNFYSMMQVPNYNNEFIRNEQDFPALTPTSNQNPQAIGSTFSTDKDDGKKAAHLQRGIQAHQNGRVTNIPPGMVGDQYGMAGVLTFLKALDKNNGLVQLALGHDLTNLGLNLGSPDFDDILFFSRNLYQSFGGPFCDSSVRTQDIECNVPDEYRTSNHIKDKLPPIKLSKLGDDTLFYLFYNCPGEAYQMVAAHELYARDWRYHKTMAVWLTRSAYGNVKEQTSTYEKGSYNIFDPTQWRKIPKEMTLEYKDLEQRPAAIATDFNKPSGNGSGGNGGGPPTTSGIPQQKILTNFSSLNIGASTPTGPQTPGGTVGKPLI
uniref:NOT2/NOT3/NOT5 C-terminal domain-containing protein n=1 Tax=Panagrolaimus superbus TaxID=310955 RepID=A0A914YEK1_9BILA